VIFYWHGSPNPTIILWGNVSSKDHLTNYEAIEYILNLASNHCSPSRAFSKNSKPQHEANAGSSSNGQKDKKKESRSSSSSNLRAKECNWYPKDSLGIASGHICTACQELKVRSDRISVEMAAPIQEVANTVSSHSSKWIFDTAVSSHISPDRNCFESVSSVRGNVVFADKIQVEYTGISYVRLACLHPGGDMFSVLLQCLPLVPSLWKSLYSSNSSWSCTEWSWSLADDTDYEYMHPALGHPCKANIIRKLYEDGYWIRDCRSNFIYNLYILSKSMHKVLILVESKPTEVFDLIPPDICRAVPNESNGGSKYFLTVIADFSRFS
jgi:hypothetical protein